MATPTYHELKLKTVAELREIAKGIGTRRGARLLADE